MCVAKDFNLTDKDFMFCQEYIACYCNQTQAYINVFKTSNRHTARTKASKLMTKEGVRACIDKLLGEVKLDKQKVLTESILTLIQIARGEADEETIIKAGKTQKQINNATQARDRISAIDILNKMYGAYEDTTNSDMEQEQQDLQEISEDTPPIEIEGYDAGQ